MIIKCVQCDIVKELSKEDIDKIKSINEDGIPRSTDYLEIFNITKGKCKGQKRHTFMFEASFSNSVQNMINSYNNMASERAKDEKELSGTNEEIINLENKLKNAKEKKDSLTENIKKSDIDIENILQEFEKMTGDKNIDIWN